MAQLPILPKPHPHGRRFSTWPTTRLGWWSLTLATIFVLFMLINGLVLMRDPVERADWQRTLLILYGISMLVCGLASGVLALIAVARRHERSWLVWLPLVVGLFVIFLVVGEFLFPH
jgi:peptidoglycan/LPS O-acetylase OafA/YrhL